MPWRVAIPWHAFAPVIVFIPRPGDGCKPGEYDAEWLPRQSPACRQIAIVGHGRRRRQAHDGLHDWILLRRGMCKVCGRTLPVLPAWCVPDGRYSLFVRQQALAQLAQGAPAEQAAPHCRDPDRLADSSTIRRWFWRRIESMSFFAALPTLFAWDWRAAGLSSPTKP